MKEMKRENWKGKGESEQRERHWGRWGTDRGE